MPQSIILPSQIPISWTRGTATPALPRIHLSLSDALQIISAKFYIQYENTEIEWLYDLQQSNGFIDLSTGDIDVILINLNSLTGSSYKATIYVELYDAEGLYETIYRDITLNISGNPTNQISTDKATYNVVYNRVQNTLTGDTLVNIINNTGDIAFETIGSLFLEKPSTDSFTLEEDPAFPFATNTELPESGSVSVNCRLKKDGVYVYTFSVNVVVIATEDITVDPGSFAFTLRKGLNETKSAVMSLINPSNKAFTIQAPVWMTLSQDSGSSSAEITMTTLNSEVLDVANYQANVIISYDSKTLIVPVSLSVLAFSVLQTSQYNFCLDNIILDVFKFYDNARFVRITVEMQISSENGEETATGNYIIPYFDDRVTTDLGKKIQNYYPIFNVSLFDFIGGYNNQLVYKPILTQIKIEEVDINYAVLHTSTITNVKFFAGHKPALFPLFTNFGMRRKYKSSLHFFSYFTGLISPDDFSGAPTADNPAGDFEVQAVALQESEVSYPELKNRLGLDFLNFPDVEKKTVLQWLNNNLVPEWFVFSGDYKITTDFEHAYDNVMINGRKYNSVDLSKLTINTGFILKEEKKLIKEIVRSLISFVKVEGEVYNCISITQKLIDADSTEDLISYDLEFLIVQ